MTVILARILALLVALGSVIVFLASWRKKRRWLPGPAIVAVTAIAAYFLIGNGLPQTFGYPFITRSYGPSIGPSLPFRKVLEFFSNLKRFERVDDIAADPTAVPPPIGRTEAETVKIELEAREVLADVAPGVTLNYWTFNGQVPGPMLRVREGDTVELTLKNHPSSLHVHSIDLHAVTGPGGGAAVMQVPPGGAKTFRFKALNPGLYVYHCATPNVAVHSAHGQYGLILVEPKGGLAQVDKEFYVVQGELYSSGGLGHRGLQAFDARKMLEARPEYVVFNGRVGGTVGDMKVARGERVRLYVGNGGVNLVSSFHVIGEIFDEVYPEGAVASETHRNIQSTIVPAGGATIVEFGADAPGTLILVDHALARMDKGAWGTLEVEGEPNPEVFEALSPQDGGAGGH